MSDPKKTENIKLTPNQGVSTAAYYLLFTTGVVGLGAIGAVPVSLAFLLASAGIIGCSTDLGKEELNLFKNVLMPHKTLSVGFLLAAAGLFGGSALMLLSGVGVLGARYQYSDFILSFEKKIDSAFDFISLIFQKAGISAPPIDQAIVVFKGAVQTVQYVANTAMALREKPAETIKQEVIKATEVAGQVITYVKHNPIEAARTGSSVVVGTITTIAAASAINVISSTAANLAYSVSVVGPVLSPIVWLGTEAFGHWLAYSVPAEWTRRGFDAAHGKIRSYFDRKDEAASEQTEQLLRLTNQLQTPAVEPDAKSDASRDNSLSGGEPKVSSNATGTNGKPKADAGGQSHYVPSFAAGLFGQGCGGQMPLVSNIFSMFGFGASRKNRMF
ncbi:MAG: hypothetical protein U1E78_05505 [Gammaproteobacteria bacterium]